MGIITSYPDDTTAADGDKYLTVDESGATRLTSLSTLRDGVLTPGSVDSDTLAQSAVTFGKLDLGSFPNSILSNSTSITVPAGTWLVIHTISLEQANTANASVFIYSVTNMQSTTWTAKASGQAAWNRITNIGVQVGAGTVSRTTSTNTNTNTPSERFIAIPLLQFA